MAALFQLVSKQRGIGCSVDNGIGYVNMPLSFSKVFFTVAGSDEIGVGTGDSFSVINAFAVSNNQVGLTAYDPRNNKYWANGIKYYTVGLVA